MKALISCYVLAPFRRYVYLDLSAHEIGQLLANGFIVKHGRWFFMG
jgi:hypothetical protein